MKNKLSTPIPVGLPLMKLAALRLTEVRSEYRAAKAQEARFVEALEERELPTRFSTSPGASSEERKAHRLARLNPKSRSFYRHLIAWRRYIRILNKLVREREAATVVANRKNREAERAQREARLVRAQQASVAAKIASRADVLMRVNRMRSREARYREALKTYRGLVARGPAKDEILAFSLLRIVLELQPLVKGSRVSVYTRGVTLMDVDAKLVALRCAASQANFALLRKDPAA